MATATAHARVGEVKLHYVVLTTSERCRQCGGKIVAMQSYSISGKYNRDILPVRKSLYCGDCGGLQ